jgi:hypothetical protein
MPVVLTTGPGRSTFYFSEYVRLSNASADALEPQIPHKPARHVVSFWILVFHAAASVAREIDKKVMFWKYRTA